MVSARSEIVEAGGFREKPALVPRPDARLRWKSDLEATHSLDDRSARYYPDNNVDQEGDTL
jgi:hypothetical protein